MAKVICVWGNSGSGKTTFSCLLARYLTSDKQKAIIISPDTSTPILPVLFPKESLDVTMSLGNLLSAVEINNASVASKVVLYKSYPFIGVLGYSIGDTPLSYPTADYHQVRLLIQAAATLVDYLILDCTSVISEFTAAAIEMSDLVIRVLTPDLYGIHYYNAHRPILEDARFKLNEHISLAGQARPFHAIDEMGHFIGGFSGILPYNKEIQRNAIEGTIFSAFNQCGVKYMEALHTVVKSIYTEQRGLEESNESHK